MKALTILTLCVFLISISVLTFANVSAPVKPPEQKIETEAAEEGTLIKGLKTFLSSLIPSEEKRPRVMKVVEELEEEYDDDCSSSNINNHDDIVPPNSNGAGWHVIHKRPLNRIISKVPYGKNKITRCLKCHQIKDEKVFNAHIQLDQNGEILKEKCLYCHVEKPDEESATFKDVKLLGDMKWLCQRCHGSRHKHPAGENHYSQPSPKTLRWMKATETVFSVILPLRNNGEVTCVTCHNPHEKGVIPNERIGAEGSDKIFRLRLADNLCIYCHGKL